MPVEWDMLGRARLLARLAKKTAKLTGTRKLAKTTDEAGVDMTTSTKKAKTSKDSKGKAEEFIRRINAVERLNTNAVYDSCPEMVSKAEGTSKERSLNPNGVSAVHKYDSPH